MGEEKNFEREVLDRLIRMETKLDVITSTCPQCQAKLASQEISLVKVDEAAKSAHKRIDRAIKIAGIISAAIGLVIQLAAFILQQAKVVH